MTTYIYREDSGYDERFDAAGDDAAEQRAEEMLREGDWGQDQAEKTFRVRAQVGRIIIEPDGSCKTCAKAIEHRANDPKPGYVWYVVDDPTEAAAYCGAGTAFHVPAVAEDVTGWRTVMVQFDPDEPGCTSPYGHDWQSPYGLVGGVRENPGVWAHGGGITVDEACARCGAGSHRDTWDTDPANGETFESVAYRPAGHYAIEAA